MEESQKLFSANGPLPRTPSPGREARDAEGFSCEYQRAGEGRGRRERLLQRHVQVASSSPAGPADKTIPCKP